MLEEADVCIWCGEVQPAQHFGLRHGEHGHCPKVVMGRFPLLTEGEDREEIFDEEPLAGSASQRIREYETPPVPKSSLHESARRFGVGPEVRARPAGLPWLPPPDLGAVI